MKLYKVYQTTSGDWVKYVGAPNDSLTGDITVEDAFGRKGIVRRNTIRKSSMRDTFPFLPKKEG